MHDVIRNFGVDYIFFDIVFLSIFIFALVKYKKRIALTALIFGGLTIFIIDWGFWLNVFHIRELVLPNSFLPFLSQDMRVALFMFWFSMTYGVMFSWMFLMFEEKSSKIGWTALLFFGWLSVAFLSQWISINNDIITTIRHMKASRMMQISFVIGGYLLLLILRYWPGKIFYLFLVGTGIHFMMEFTLWASGIRPSTLELLVVNSLLESNMGVPILYIFYDKFLVRKLKAVS